MQPAENFLHHLADAAPRAPVPSAAKLSGAGMRGVILKAVGSVQVAALHADNGMESRMQRPSPYCETRFVTALRRRMQPNTPLSRAQLANAVGCSERTVDNWLGGSPPSGPHLLSLIQIFDRAFVAEVTGGDVPKLSDARRKLQEALAVLEAAEALA